MSTKNNQILQKMPELKNKLPVNVDYLRGIIESDGSLSLQISTTDGNPKVNPVIKIAQNQEKSGNLLTDIQDFLTFFNG